MKCTLLVLFKFLLSYIIYTATFTCPINKEFNGSDVFVYSPNEYTCRLIHQLKPYFANVQLVITPVWEEQVKPILATHVQPVWISHVQPVIHHVQLIWSSYLEPVLSKYSYAVASVIDPIWDNIYPIWKNTIKPKGKRFNEKFEITSQLSKAGAYSEHVWTNQVSPTLVNFKNNQVVPFLKVARVEFEYQILVFKAHLSRYLQLGWIQIKKQVRLYVSPIFAKIYSIKQVKVVVDYIANGYAIFSIQLEKVYERFWQSPTRLSLHRKLEFLKSEFKNVYEKTDTAKKASTRTAKKASTRTAKKDSTRSAKSIIEEVNAAKSAIIEEVMKEVIHEKDVEKENAEDAAEITEEVFLGDEETVEITITFTSTIEDSLTVSSTAQEILTQSTIEENLPQETSLINLELTYWGSKVNKTLNLALLQIEDTIAPVINDTIASAIGPISEELQELQRANHKHYQELNKMIMEVNRDYERMKVSNDSTIETVTRLQLRELIAEARQLPENISMVIQDLLITHHESLLESYFRSVQDTIDILETFAETTISEFQRKLSGILEDQDDEVVWGTWKKFHQIKEDIFEFRDFVFKQANDYKEDNKKTTAVGLEPWNVYLRKVEFHINFLVRDNDDYLRLVRAKANVAFQLREGLQAELEAAEAAAEAAAEEAAEEAATEEDAANATPEDDAANATVEAANATAAHSTAAHVANNSEIETAVSETASVESTVSPTTEPSIDVEAAANEAPIDLPDLLDFANEPVDQEILDVLEELEEEKELLEDELEALEIALEGELLEVVLGVLNA